MIPLRSRHPLNPESGRPTVDAMVHLRTQTVEAVGGPADGEWLPGAPVVVVIDIAASVVRHEYRLERDHTGVWLQYAGSFARELQSA